MSTPLADVKEYLDTYVIVMNTPGMKSEDINAQVMVEVKGPRWLEISGERKMVQEPKVVKYLSMERGIGKFTRRFPLSKNVNLNTISGICRDGVLTITIRKELLLPVVELKWARTNQVHID